MSRFPALPGKQIDVPSVYVDASGPWTLVNDRFQATGAYAATAFTMAETYTQDVLALVKALDKWNLPDITVDDPDVPGIDYTSRPTLGALELDQNWPDNDAVRPTLDVLPTITVPDIPVFNISAPNIQLPDRPGAITLTGPGDAPVITNPDLPAAPRITLPDVPVFADIPLPAPPSITIPAFDATIVDQVFSDPVPFNWQESPYNSELWQDIVVKTREGIINGGTGLNPEVEQAIWDRALSRLDIAADKAYQEAERYFAAKGFDMPPGALAAKVQEIRAEGLRARTDLTRDISVKQAELAQQNTQFMLEYGRQAETILREFHNVQQNRALEASKAIAASSIEILNAQIAKYNGQIEKYKADAQVYGERVRAALVNVEIFRGQVEGAKVSVEVQRALADLYSKQLQGVEIIASLYKTEMEGARLAMEVEAQKIEVFKSRVTAYVAEIDAEKTKVDAYTSAVQGEKVAAELYSEQVKAYVASLEVPKTQVLIQDTAVRAIGEKNRVEIERYKAELQSYIAEVDAEARKIGAIVDGFSAEVSAYNAETGTEKAHLEVQVAQISAAIQAAQFTLQRQLAEIESTTNAYTSIKKLQMDGTLGVTNVAAQLAASAMNAVSASASLGYSGSESLGASFNYGGSISENHSWSYPVEQLEE